MTKTSRDHSINNNGDHNNNNNKEDQKKVEALVEEGLGFARHVEACHPQGHQELVVTLEMYRAGLIRHNGDFFFEIENAFSDHRSLMEDLCRIFLRKDSSKAYKPQKRKRGQKSSKEEEKKLRDLMVLYFSGQTCTPSYLLGKPRMGPRVLNGLRSAAARRKKSRAVEKSLEIMLNRSLDGSEDESE